MDFEKNTWVEVLVLGYYGKLANGIMFPLDAFLDVLPVQALAVDPKLLGIGDERGRAKASADGEPGRVQHAPHLTNGPPTPAVRSVDLPFAPNSSLSRTRASGVFPACDMGAIDGCPGSVTSGMLLPAPADASACTNGLVSECVTSAAATPAPLAGLRTRVGTGMAAERNISRLTLSTSRVSMTARSGGYSRGISRLILMFS